MESHSEILRAYSWQDSEDHIRCWRLNPGQSQARQSPYPLYYLSDPLTPILSTYHFVLGPRLAVFRLMAGSRGP